MKILVACEESQAVTIELRRLGHEVGTWFMKGGKDRQKNRAKTFPGVARAALWRNSGQGLWRGELEVTMERLTVKCDDGHWGLSLTVYDKAIPSRILEKLQIAIDRLAAYEDTMSIERAQELAQAEKDGRLWILAVLPQGRPGFQKNRVYVIEDGEIYADYVADVYISVDSNGELCCIYEPYDGSDFYDADIGKTVFLTREEAEAALKKREEADNETD